MPAILVDDWVCAQDAQVKLPLQLYIIKLGGE